MAEPFPRIHLHLDLEFSRRYEERALYLGRAKRAVDIGPDLQRGKRKRTPFALYYQGDPFEARRAAPEPRRSL